MWDRAVAQEPGHMDLRLWDQRNEGQKRYHIDVSLVTLQNQFSVRQGRAGIPRDTQKISKGDAATG